MCAYRTVFRGWVGTGSGKSMPESLDRFRFDPHATGEEELARRRAVAYHISGHAHWEGIKVRAAVTTRRGAVNLLHSRLTSLTSAVRLPLLTGHFPDVHADWRRHCVC